MYIYIYIHIPVRIHIHIHMYICIHVNNVCILYRSSKPVPRLWRPRLNVSHCYPPMDGRGGGTESQEE